MRSAATADSIRSRLDQRSGDHREGSRRGPILKSQAGNLLEVGKIAGQENRIGCQGDAGNSQIGSSDRPALRPNLFVDCFGSLIKEHNIEPLKCSSHFIEPSKSVENLRGSFGSIEVRQPALHLLLKGDDAGRDVVFGNSIQAPHQESRFGTATLHQGHMIGVEQIGHDYAFFRRGDFTG